MTILIVDDDVDLLYIEERFLMKAGYRVLCAENVPRSLQLMRQETPDLLLLDINLPTGTGLNIHQHLRSVTQLRDIPVIYITGERSESTQRKTQAMGAFATLYKPIALDLLLKVIRRH